MFGHFKLFLDSYYDEDKIETTINIGYMREHQHIELKLRFFEPANKSETLIKHTTDTLMPSK